jgi:hypothetical protein
MRYVAGAPASGRLGRAVTMLWSLQSIYRRSWQKVTGMGLNLWSGFSEPSRACGRCAWSRCFCDRHALRADSAPLVALRVCCVRLRSQATGPPLGRILDEMPSSQQAGVREWVFGVHSDPLQGLELRASPIGRSSRARFGSIGKKREPLPRSPNPRLDLDPDGCMICEQRFGVGPQDSEAHLCFGLFRSSISPRQWFFWLVNL